MLPEIERSPAYKSDGLIAITFDQAPQTGPHADPTACCDAQTFPNLVSTTAPGATAPAGTGTASTSNSTTTSMATSTTPAFSGGKTTPTGGGGQVGLLLISPYVKPGSVDNIDYFNHFSLLASIEDIFGLRKLGYAADPALPVFDAAVFNGKP